MNPFSRRSLVIIIIFSVTALLFLIKLLNMQVFDSSYKKNAANNVVREIVQFPARGLIFDRKGKLLVFNKPSYDLMITPLETEDFDTLYLCRLLEVEKEYIRNQIKAAKTYSKYKPSVVVKQITPETYAVLQEQLYKFKGFHIQPRTLREYTFNSAAHFLGYVSEVTPDDIKDSSFYIIGDYIGMNGIEKSYENQLRGEKGVKKYLVDVHNRIKGEYLNGAEDISATTGKNIKSTIDIELQKYAEELLTNKRGSIVMIEPSTGEILTLASAPYYDPKLLVGRIRGNNYAKLSSDSLKPLFNRAVMADYPPGSTFKMLNVLVGLQEQVLTTETRFACNGPESVPLKCTHFHGSPVSLIDAIRESCNPFMWNALRATILKYKSTPAGYAVWRDYMFEFGIGRKLETDFSGESRGNLPSEAYYNRSYGKGKWNTYSIKSLSIGQDAIGVTPLQMANYCSIIANRGYYYIPHIVKEVVTDTLDSRLTKKINTRISAQYFEPVIIGMEKTGGVTVPGIIVCGKTGTAQNPHGDAHSAYIAFAPRDNPRVAISVYIENGKWGATYAEPIANLMMEKYLNDTIAYSRKWLEKNMINANLLKSNQLN